MSDTDDRGWLAPLLDALLGPTEPAQPAPQPQGLGAQPCCWTVNDRGEVVPL